MSNRPVSVPPYQWPERWLTRPYAPWRWLAAAAFHSARVAGRIAAATTQQRRAVAVIRTDGAGDAILFEPTLRSLARNFDGCEVDFWAPQLVCELFEAHPAVARFVTVPRGFKPGNHRLFWSIAWRMKLGWALGRNTYEAAVYLPDDPEPLGAWLVAWLRAGEKWINGGSTINQFNWQREWSHKFATRVLQSRAAGGHDLQRSAHLAMQWGSAIETDRPDLPFSNRASTYAGVQVGAARHAVRRARAAGLVGIIPAGSAAINQFPAEKWAEAIRLLWKEHELLCALLGGPQDEMVLNQIDQLLADVPHHRFPSDHDIAVSAAIVSRLDALLSVDTGLAHAAVAHDLPTVALVSGGMPGRFWPWPIATRSIALTKPTACAGCNYRCTQITPICITDLSADQIVEALVRTMRKKRILPQLDHAKEYRHAG